MLLTLLSSFVLSYAVIKWLNKFNFFKHENYKLNLITLGLITSIGSLASYGLGPQTLSYNHYTLIFGNVFLALILLISVNITNKKRIFILSAILGVILAFQFYVKAPNSLLFFLTYLITQFFHFKTIKNYFFVNLVIVLLSVIATITLISLPLTPIYFIKDYYNELSILSQSTAHNIWDLVGNYIFGCKDIWQYHLSNYKYTLLILTFCLVLLLQKQYNWLFNIANIIFIGVFLSLMYILYEKEYFVSGIKHIGTQTVVYIIMVFLITIILVSNWLLQQKRKFSFQFTEKCFIVILFLFFPIICALGSTNFIHIQIIFHLSTWFILAFICFLYVKTINPNFNILLLLLLFAFVIKSCLNVYTATVTEPYRVNGTLYTQTEPLYIKTTNETIYIDKDLKNNLTLLANSISASKPLAFCTSTELMGLAYVFDKKLIGYGIYPCSSKSANQYICQAFNKSELTKDKIYFLLSLAEEKCLDYPCFVKKNRGEKLFSIPWTNIGNDSLFVYSRIK
ncbi:MAG: hypothetical protein V4667_13935 [Bacteroidota bacterium]